MVGKFDIEIYNNKVHYFLTVKRNITILQGNSATGKTKLRLSVMHKNIVFIDEIAAFVKSKRFAEMVRGSDNYFVIVTRDDLSQLPYSVDEIYGLRNVSDNQKYKILPHYLFRGL